jgi:Protein of unknown function (DUF3237)
MQGKCYGSKIAVEDSRLPTLGAPALSHLPGFDDAAVPQSVAPKGSEIWGPWSDARQSGSAPSALRLRGSSVDQAPPSSPFSMTGPSDLVTRALVILAEKGRRMAAASAPQPAAEPFFNCPSCGFVNKTAARFCGSCGRVFPDLPGASLASDNVPTTTTTTTPTLQTKERRAATAARVPSMRRAQDGSELRWGEADTPVPPAVISPGTPASVTISVSPARPGHAVTVEYRIDGGPIRQVVAVSEPRVHGANACIYRALLPGQSHGMVEFLPVLRFAGQPISPRLGESAECPRYQVGWGAASVETADLSAGEPRWEWGASFLWAGTAALRKEVIGAMPDGLRINLHVTEGRFAGPRFEGIVLPGGSNWLRIRKDGVAIVNVTECLQTRSGARIDCLYDGILDLGADGYGRAMRGDFGILPPFVLAPTYATSDKELAWLNRAQCIGVGRVDITTLRAEYDVYVVTVGAAKRPGPDPLLWRRTNEA